MMKANVKRVLIVLWVVSANLLLSEVSLGENSQSSLELPWYETDTENSPQVHFYFFWSETCKHCREAKPFLKKILQDRPWLIFHSYSKSHPDYLPYYQALASKVNGSTQYVPAFIFCNQMVVGFRDKQTTGAQLSRALDDCYEQVKKGEMKVPDQSYNDNIYVPGFGEYSTEKLSLPVLTLLIAGLDAFNPCAFFVLLFLLSLLVHAHSRSRMILVGGVFVAISGLMYFLFMAAWLNLFLMIGEQRFVTLAAGGIAILLGLINMKDYFWFKRGISLSIPEKAKPSLFARMRELVLEKKWPLILIGTVVLAITANSYEILCTAGFPMLFTRILTLSELPGSEYYLYLIFYNLIYVLPLAFIVLIFVFTLGSRKLQESEGRALKLLSGFMMTGLGALLVFAPQYLDQLSVAFGLIGISLLLTVAGAVLTRFIGRFKAG